MDEQIVDIWMMARSCSPRPSDWFISLEDGEFHEFLACVWRGLGGGIPDRRPSPGSFVSEVTGVNKSMKPELSTDTIRTCVSVKFESIGKGGLLSVVGRYQMG
jgi:hypothetical protein